MRVRLVPIRLTLLACLVVLGGCASASAPDAPVTSRSSDAIEGPALQSLRDKSARSGRAPNPLPPPPPSLVSAGLVPDASLDDRATMTLEDVIALTGAWTDEQTPVASDVSHEDRVLAIKEYAAGRALILQGNAADAEAALEEAVWLDPAAGPAWISLGRAKLALGKRVEALQALERAVKLGELDPTALDALGRASLESGDPDRAIEYLAGALCDESSISDEGLINVLFVDLAMALNQSGYLLAGIEATQRGLALPQAGVAITSQGPELESIRRRAPALLTASGDAAIRLGRFDLAAESYADAAALISSPSNELLARRVYASLCVGRDADAALSVLDHIIDQEGVASPADRHLLRYLADHAHLGTTLGDAVGEVRTWAGTGSTTMTIDLALAQSETLKPSQARRLLRDTMATSGVTGPLITQLLRTHGGSSAEDIVAEAIGILNMAPLEGDEIVSRLFRLGLDQTALEAAIADSRAPRAGELQGWYELALHDPEGVLAALDTLDREMRDAPSAQLLAVRAMAMAGAWAQVQAELDALYTRTDVESKRALVRALFSVQRFSDARAIASRLADQTDATTLDLLNASRLAIDAGEGWQAKAWLERALQRDAHDEASRELLITLALESTPPDQSLATANVRAIRELRPGGRLVRWVMATQMLQRGFGARAEPVLDSLIQDEPGDRRAFDALMSVWVEQSANIEGLNEALAWVETQVERRPLDVWLVAGQARLLAAAGRGEEAVLVLKDAYDQNPAPILAWHRETMLRELLDRPEEAEALTMRRLGDGPLGIDATIDLVTYLLSDGRLAEFPGVLADHTPEAFELTREQASGLSDAINESLTERSSLRPALKVLASIGDRCAPIPGEMTMLWLALLREPTAMGPAGSVEDALDLVNATGETGALEVLNAIRRQGQEPPLPPGELASPRAELAYVLGGQFFDEDRGNALELYRAALRFDPSHAFAANDLGYFLLEGGGDLDEIDDLLTVALAGEPESASVLDSVGWLRYHQGRLTDRTGTSGEPINRGAISLLRAALEIRSADIAGTGRDDLTLEIRSHLGDALWRADNQSEAVAQWQTGLDIAETFIRRNRGRRDPAVVERIRVQADAFSERLRAAAAGREPPIAQFDGN